MVKFRLIVPGEVLPSFLPANPVRQTSDNNSDTIIGMMRIAQTRILTAGMQSFMANLLRKHNAKPVPILMRSAFFRHDVMPIVKPLAVAHGLSVARECRDLLRGTAKRLPIHRLAEGDVKPQPAAESDHDQRHR